MDPQAHEPLSLPPNKNKGLSIRPGLEKVGGRVARSLLILLEMALSYFSCWQDEVCFTSSEFGREFEPLSIFILLFSLPLSGRCPDLTEILLTRTLSHDPINQSKRESISSGMCEQQRRRPACAFSQSDQRLCYSLFAQYHT